MIRALVIIATDMLTDDICRATIYLLNAIS